MNIQTAPSTRRGDETKARILAAATELIHARGYKNTGLHEILEASGVPKGSFYFYFRSKEDLATELISRYRKSFQEDAVVRFFPPDGDPIAQILGFYRDIARFQTDGGCKMGCLIGNLAAEVTDGHEGMRREVLGCFNDIKELIAAALTRGQTTGDLVADFSPQQASGFLLSVLEGTILLAKAGREPRAFVDSDAMLTRYLETLRATKAPAGTGMRAGGPR